MSNGSWTTERLSPFGLEVHAGGINDVEAIGAPVLKDWIAQGGYVLLRGFAPLSTDALLRVARSLGEPLEWEFGAINELVAKADARNYIYTTAAVPFHWDGAFVGKIPHYILFSCEVAPPENTGGETLFCDGGRLLDGASAEQRALWERTSVTYSCEKVVHYGGSFTSPMIVPVNGGQQQTLRFAEPVHDLNPVTLTVPGMSDGEVSELASTMAALLRDPRYCVAHTWRAGDVLIADNLSLLHGRTAFTHAGLRHIRRVNVL